MQSQTSSRSLIAIKSILDQGIIKNKVTAYTAYKHWSLQLQRELTTILIAIKNKRLILQDTGSTEYIANNNFNPLLLNNSPTNPKIETATLYT